MPRIPIPGVAKPKSGSTEQVREHLTDVGIARLSELRDQLSLDRYELRLALAHLVERGDVAVFPVGNTVQVRDES